tara:strand:- start:288 stop:461 length:174 start_codon:yes stop_codon:yes gene_type:complete
MSMKWKDEGLEKDECDVCGEDAYLNIDLRCRECVRGEETLPFPGLRLIGNLRKYGRK